MTASYAPATVQSGIVTQDDLTLGVSDNVPLPKVADEHMIIVKTRAVALNPSDNKMYVTFPSPGAVNGADFAGDVVSVGSAVTKWRVGDCVMGAVQGGNPNSHGTGAFQEYIPTYDYEVMQKPENMSYEVAASIGGACITVAAVALFCSLGLSPLPGGKAPEKPSTVLVYGGSTATGAVAIQLIKLSGHNPIATCSPHNFELVKTRGASAVFDYHEPSCAADIKAYTSDKLSLVLDCITTASSIKFCDAAMGRMGGKYTALEQIPPIPGLRKIVKRDWVMANTISGRDIDFGNGYVFPVNPDHVAFGKEWRPICQRLVNDGSVLPHPIRVLEQGWLGVLRGLDELREKKVSGQKLVCQIC